MLVPKLARTIVTCNNVICLYREVPRARSFNSLVWSSSKQARRAENTLVNILCGVRHSLILACLRLCHTLPFVLCIASAYLAASRPPFFPSQLLPQWLHRHRTIHRMQQRRIQTLPQQTMTLSGVQHHARFPHRPRSISSGRSGR